jgi:hypothetical protein
MKCGICGKKMNIVKEEVFGERVKVFQCQCGEELVELDEAIRLQKKVLPKIHEVRKVVSVGSSSAVTIPKELQRIFRKGDNIVLDFSPKDMTLKVSKTLPE